MTDHEIILQILDELHEIKELLLQSKAIFKKPTIAEIEAYCKERENSISATAFYNYYESKNWFVGKSKMKDWKAAVRTWERSEDKSIADEVANW